MHIRAAHARGRGIYGPLKIQTELAAQGVMAGINRIKRLRTLYGIRCTHKKKFRVTTDSKHLMPCLLYTSSAVKRIVLPLTIK